MKPEQAREIDRQEFEADCRAARERAHALADQRNNVGRDLNARLNAPAPKSALAAIKVKRNVQFLTFDGVSLTIAEWSRRTGIAMPTIRWRIAHGWSVDRVLARKPGVASDFRDIPATDAPRHAQHFSELEISE